MQHALLTSLLLVAVLIAGCAPVLSVESPGEHEPEAAAVTPVVTAASVALVPSGWATFDSQQCEYTIGYPSDMRVTEQTPYSQLFGFEPSNGQEATPNFVYVSVIVPAVQDRIDHGALQSEVYNYDPAVMQALLKLQVGESGGTSPVADLQPSFTYQRTADAAIGGYSARVFENSKPWEFPAGTKEIRYYVSAGNCAYLVGGYMDTTGAGKPGGITEDLFSQIISTVQLMP